MQSKPRALAGMLHRRRCADAEYSRALAIPTVVSRMRLSRPHRGKPIRARVLDIDGDGKVTPYRKGDGLPDTGDGK